MGQRCDEGDEAEVKDCCSKEQPCTENQGDCDHDNECATGLYCAKRQCSATFYNGADCCKPITHFQPNPTCNGGGYGMKGCCSEEQPCGEGQGDCDSDDDKCGPGYSCGSNNCPSSFYNGADCCTKGKIETLTF